jgi:hypothetical protein
MEERNIFPGSITDTGRKELNEAVGLAAYVQDLTCSVNNYPYIPAVDGWSSGNTVPYFILNIVHCFVHTN